MTAELNLSPLYARFERHSVSRAALVIAFLWGLAEATLFFIVPDVHLALVALIRWRRGLLATLVAVAGALIGGTIMYTLTAYNEAAMIGVLVRVPYINAEIVRAVSAKMQASGLGAMVSFPLLAPYKVYAVQAARHHAFLSFLLMSIPSRLGRILPVILTGAAVGVVFRRFIQRRTALVIGAYALLWVAVYVVYYLQMR